jgi:hypothetical protein
MDERREEIFDRPAFDLRKVQQSRDCRKRLD